MRKIENFAQISDLLNAQLKRGVLTNNFLRGDDYTREIANGLTRWPMLPRSSALSAFVRCCAARGAPANRKHFRWKQPQFLQIWRISRIFPAF